MNCRVQTIITFYFHYILNQNKFICFVDVIHFRNKERLRANWQRGAVCGFGYASFTCCIALSPRQCQIEWRRFQKWKQLITLTNLFIFQITNHECGEIFCFVCFLIIKFMFRRILKENETMFYHFIGKFIGWDDVLFSFHRYNHNSKRNAPGMISYW